MLFLIDNQKWNNFLKLQRFRYQIAIIFKLFLFLSSLKVLYLFFFQKIKNATNENYKRFRFQKQKSHNPC